MTPNALIDSLAQHRPEVTAVETGEQLTSYQQLLDLTRAIREQIRRSPARPGPIVIADDPGAGACAAIAAAQDLGRAYVPLSASHPATRIQQILAAVEPALIVQSDRTAARLADVLSGRYPVLTISGQPGSNLSWARSPGPAESGASLIGGDIAYVMFTSGTTGRPKGVPVRAESLRAYLDVATKHFGVQPGDRASHFFELTFDLSVHDIFVTLLGGGTLVVIPAEQRMLPARFLREKEISHWFSVPSAAESLHRVGALRPGIFPHLKQTLFCGEPLRWPVTEAWQAAAPDSCIVNLYGPTEATIAISSYVVPRRRSRSDDIYGIVPIGQVFEGQHGRIHGRPEAGGRPDRGEMWLSGSQVISGYLDAGDGRDAFATGPDGAAWYRTGDAVERDGDGLLHFVGRIDHQLKISGYRVEPAEVEDAIHRAFPACRSVVVRCDRGKHRGLVAAIFCEEGDGPAASAVREACASSLPPYMIPAHVIGLASWPVNANGKIDRAAVRRQLEEQASPGAVARHGARS